ncbi:MAG: hypothetical protein DI629_12260 [Mesorhizobium amorphae]|nr:MAG: hypothetical protein DI629_12260 [Mesorhizobium amorphae]
MTSSLTYTGMALGALLLSHCESRAEEMVCAPFDRIAANLARLYNETPVADGAVDKNAAIIVFSTPDGSTFTIVSAGLDGNACVLASGEGWGTEVIVAGRAL